MKCPGKEMIFNYVAGELSSEANQILEAHFSQCAACRKILSETEQQTSLVQQKLKKFAPSIIPERPDLQAKINLKKSKLKIGANAKQESFIRFPASRRLVLAGVMGIILIFCMVRMNLRHKIDEGAIYQMMMQYEDELGTDPKTDWLEKRIIISIIDEKENTIEFIQSTKENEEISREKFKIENGKFLN